MSKHGIFHLETNTYTVTSCVLNQSLVMHPKFRLWLITAPETATPIPAVLIRHGIKLAWDDKITFDTSVRQSFLAVWNQTKRSNKLFEELQIKDVQVRWRKREGGRKVEREGGGREERREERRETGRQGERERERGREKIWKAGWSLFRSVFTLLIDADGVINQASTYVVFSIGWTVVTLPLLPCVISLYSSPSLSVWIKFV